MPMTEEEILALQKQNQELTDKLKAVPATPPDVLAKLEALDKENKERAQREQALTIDLAKRDAVSTYANIKGFDDLVKGGTKEEIMASAKALSEKIAAREVEIRATAKASPASMWSSVPSSENSALALPKERQDEYATVRAMDTKGPRQFMDKMVLLMGMHMQDLGTKNLLKDRARLGL